MIGELQCDQARDDVGWTAGGVGNDHAHGSLGVALRPCSRLRRNAGERSPGKMQELTAVQLHGVPLWKCLQPPPKAARGSPVRTAPANAKPSIFKCRYACRRRQRWPMQAARISACPRLEQAALGQATRMAENSEARS